MKAANGSTLPQPLPVGAVRGLPGPSEGSSPLGPAAKKSKTASPGAEPQVELPPASSLGSWILGNGVSICTRGKGKNGLYQDLVWTPQLAAAKKLELQTDAEMAFALFKAFELHDGEAVTLSQLGSNDKVAQLKRHSQFKNVRLLDIVKQHENIFEVQPDGISGGWTVKRVPGAQAALALPGAEAISEQNLGKGNLMLPARIENPVGTKEKMQALRIELLHVLSRRGDRVPLQELGQVARVQQRKQGLHQAKKLIDFIRIFPRNFSVSADDDQMVVETASTNVADTSMIELSIQRSQQEFGKGFGSRHRHAPSRHPQHMSPPAQAPPAPPAVHCGFHGAPLAPPLVPCGFHGAPPAAPPAVPCGFHGGGFDFSSLVPQINAAAHILGNGMHHSMHHVGGVPGVGYAHYPL